MLDAHQHFWLPARGDYDWLGPHVAPLLRDFMPDDLRPLLRRAGVTRTIAIQAAATEAETEFLLALAMRTDFVAGVVGWLDLDSEDFAAQLADLTGSQGAASRLVGLRPMLQDLPDNWILRPRVLDNLRQLAATGLALDLLVKPHQLRSAAEALRRTPGLRAVLDHLGKPLIEAGTLDPWRADLDALALLPGVHCKLSGLVTEASHQGWTLRDLQPFVDHAVAAFGVGRLIFGSDWPVCTLAGSYGEVGNAARALLAPHCDAAGMAAVFGGTGAAFYRIAL